MKEGELADVEAEKAQAPRLLLIDVPLLFDVLVTMVPKLDEGRRTPTPL